MCLIISNNFIIECPHIDSIQPKTTDPFKSLLNLHTRIIKGLMSIMNYNTRLLHVFLYDNIVLFLQQEHLLFQEHTSKVKQYLVDLDWQSFVRNQDYWCVFHEVSVHYLDDLFSLVDVWIKYCDINLAGIVLGSYSHLIHKVIKMLRVYHLLDHILVRTVEKMKFCFHIEYSVPKKTTYLLVFRIIYT